MNNGLPAELNQGNNIVQNINQNTVSNNVAQQIVQQNNNSNMNVGDGLPNTPNQSNAPSWETSMSDWFVARMTGKNRDRYGNVSTDGIIHSPPISDFVGLDAWAGAEGPVGDGSRQWKLARIREDVPNYARHGHPDFDGDWVRWTRSNPQGYFFRPTSNNNYR